jgi:hypothetical protein
MHPFVQPRPPKSRIIRDFASYVATVGRFMAGELPTNSVIRSNSHFWCFPARAARCRVTEVGLVC